MVKSCTRLTRLSALSSGIFPTEGQTRVSWIGGGFFIAEPAEAPESSEVSSTYTASNSCISKGLSWLTVLNTIRSLCVLNFLTTLRLGSQGKAVLRKSQLGSLSFATRPRVSLSTTPTRFWSSKAKTCQVPGKGNRTPSLHRWEGCQGSE